MPRGITILPTDARVQKTPWRVPPCGRRKKTSKQGLLPPHWEDICSTASIACSSSPKAQRSCVFERVVRANGSTTGRMANRSQLASSQETRNAQLADQVADRDQAIARLKALGEDQPAATIAAKIEAAKKDRRWELTEACASATASSSRDFCQGVYRLKGQLDVAATATVLREKIDKLNKSIEALRSQGRRAIGRSSIVWTREVDWHGPRHCARRAFSSARVRDRECVLFWLAGSPGRFCTRDRHGRDAA